MSCSKCYEKFTLFKKQIGCTSCGYGICSKCCKKFNKKDVCIDCHKKLTSTESTDASSCQPELPENFKKLIKQNEMKQKERVGNSADDEIANRLKKLSEAKGESRGSERSVNDDELHSRLNNLMQINPATAKLSNLPSAKPTVNTAEDLIKQLSEEAHLDKQMDDHNKSELENLEKRVKKLLEPLPGQQQQAAAVNVNEIAGTRKTKSSKANDLMKQLLCEAEADYKNKNESEEDDEMDKWCCICNDDGAFKCVDCDNDVYCKRCFKECHDKYEYKSHRKANV